MFVCAVALDVRVADWAFAHSTKLFKSAPWVKPLKFPGHFGFTAALAALIYVLRRDWKPVAALLLAGITSGLLYTLAKWLVGRTRPHKGVPPFELHPFAKGIAGLWRAENMAFPSGHACLAFATAVVMARVYPGLAWLAYAVAAVTGVERICEGAHYPSDVSAALAVGALSAIIACRAIEGFARRAPSDAPPLEASLPLPGSS